MSTIQKLKRRNSDKGSSANLESTHFHPQFHSFRIPEPRNNDDDESGFRPERPDARMPRPRRNSKSRSSFFRTQPKSSCLKFLPFQFLFKKCRCCFEDDAEGERCQSGRSKGTVSTSLSNKHCECRGKYEFF